MSSSKVLAKGESNTPTIQTSKVAANNFLQAIIYFWEREAITHVQKRVKGPPIKRKMVNILYTPFAVIDPKEVVISSALGYRTNIPLQEKKIKSRIKRNVGYKDRSLNGGTGSSMPM